MTPEKLRELREIGNAATSGPWTELESANVTNDLDIKFIATARNHWDELLDEIEAQQAVIDTLRKSLRETLAAAALRLITLENDIVWLKEENTKLRYALEFYADLPTEKAVWSDGGDIARKALHRSKMTPTDKTQAFYDNERNAKIEWFWDAGFTVTLGDTTNGWKEPVSFETFAEASDFLFSSLPQP